MIYLKNTVLFDLDGTLVNSLYDLKDASNYMLNKLGLPERNLEEIRAFVGNGIDMLVKRSVGNLPFDFDKAMAYFKEYYSANMCSKTVPYNGIYNVIDSLKENNFKLGVVTNKAQYAAEKIVEHYFPGKFDIIVGADLSKRQKKPDPAPVNYALDALGTSNKNAIYVGDSEVDIETAKNSKTDFIGVTWGFRKAEIFKNEMYKASSPYELISLCCNFL